MISGVNRTENTQKPMQVKMAILLLYIFSLINLLVNAIVSGINGKGYFPSPIQVIFFIINIILVYLISSGKSWPRFLLLAFYIFCLCSILWLFPRIVVDLRYQFIMVATGYLLGFISVILLFLKPAKQWFDSFK